MPDLTFIAYREAPLAVGYYRVEVTQQLVAGDQTQDLGTSTLQFASHGPRFVLPPGSVAETFPASGATGRFAGVLPHVVLADATLPWLRSPTPDEVPGRPWLALLVLSSRMLGRVSIASTTAGELGSDGVDEAPDTPVEVLALAPRLAARLLPKATDLPWLAHVRELADPSAPGGVRSTAVVVGHRVPAPGASEVHLVSIEGLYDGSGPVTSRLPVDPTDPSRVLLVSLARWRFSNDARGPTFDTLAAAVAADFAPLRQRVAPQDPAAPHLARGAILLPHVRPDGRTLSWYRGPFVPSVSDPSAEAINGVLAKGQPVRSADLILRDRGTGLLDVTYATAFDLGRALTLANSAVAVALDRWKRQLRRASRTDGVLGTLASHLSGSPEAPPAEVARWFAQLARLEPVPDRYLVPDVERLLPRRTGSPAVARCFVLDRFWVDCLLHGAFSVGRVTAAERAADAGLHLPRAAEPQRVGLLLRGDLGSWPAFRIDAWSEVFDAPGMPTAAPLVSTQRDLASDLRLVLIDSRPVDGGWAAARTIELSQRPDGLHFAVEGTTAGSALDLAATAAALGAAHSGELARAMVARPGRLRLTLQVSQAGGGA